MIRQEGKPYSQSGLKRTALGSAALERPDTLPLEHPGTRCGCPEGSRLVPWPGGLLCRKTSEKIVTLGSTLSAVCSSPGRPQAACQMFPFGQARCEWSGAALDHFKRPV